MTSRPERTPGAFVGGALDVVLPAAALATAALTIGATLLAAGPTLGYDFRAYYAAAERALAGQPLYDVSTSVAGPYGVFLYPPLFLPLVLPLVLLPVDIAVVAWTALLLAASAAGIAILPLSSRVRWLTLLLAAQSWPFLYAIKLGQVGPLLLLLFAIGWRWMDRPGVLGLAAGLGTAIKIQPAAILAWAFLTRRFAALIAGGVVLAALAIVATLVVGATAWPDFVVVLTRVADPITTPHNVTPGSVAYQLGASRDVAAAIQWLSVLATLALLVFAAVRLASVPSYLVAVVASQLLSPILWDHYAMLLLLPVAWMIDRGRWWAAGVPLATSILLIGVTPVWVYPVAFWACLVGVVGVALNPGPGVLVRRPRGAGAPA